MHNLYAALLCFLFALIVFTMFGESFDRELDYQDARLENSLSQADRERVIANLKGEYK